MKKKGLKIQLMYEQGLAFSQCADKCYPLEDSSPWEFVAHSTVSSVNSAFACEVFLKTLLDYYDVEYKRIHNLMELFELLPESIQISIKDNVVKSYGSWCDPFGIAYLKRTEDVFVKWRYSYEIDHARLFSGFLICFRKILQLEIESYIQF